MLIGGERDDLLDGGSGHDVLWGKEGADRLKADDRRLDFVIIDADDVVSRDRFDIVIPAHQLENAFCKPFPWHGGLNEWFGQKRCQH